MTKKKFEDVSVEIVTFNEEDVIRTSGGGTIKQKENTETSGLTSETSCEEIKMKNNRKTGKNIKRKFLLFLTLCAGLALFAACGENSTSTSDNSASGNSVSISESADNSSAENSSADNSSADNSSADNSSADNSSAENSSADNSSAENSSADNSSAENSSADNSSAENSSGDDSSADNSSGDDSQSVGGLVNGGNFEAH